MIWESGVECWSRHQCRRKKKSTSFGTEFQGIICIFTRHKDVFAKRNERPEPWVFILHSHVAKGKSRFLLKETFYIGHYNPGGHCSHGFTLFPSHKVTYYIPQFTSFDIKTRTNWAGSTLGHVTLVTLAWRKAKKKMTKYKSVHQTIITETLK